MGVRVRSTDVVDEAQQVVNSLEQVVGEGVRVRVRCAFAVWVSVLWSTFMQLLSSFGVRELGLGLGLGLYLQRQGCGAAREQCMPEAGLGLRNCN